MMSVSEIYSSVGGDLPDEYDKTYRAVRGHPLNCAICGVEFRGGDWLRHYLHVGPGGNYHACVECSQAGDVPQKKLDEQVEALYWELHSRFAHFLDDEDRKGYQRRLAKVAQP